MKKERFKGAKAVIISFFVLLFLGAAVALVIPLRPDYSEAEKRELTKFPEFSFSALADGSFFNGISTWYADTFPFREIFIGASSKIKSFYGIGDSISGFSDSAADEIPDTNENTPPVTLPVIEETTQEQIKQEQTTKKQPTADEPLVQNLGTVLVVGDAAYEYYTFIKKTADKYAATVNTVALSLKDKANVYDIVVPTSTDITLPASVRKGLNTSNQKDAINYIYSVLASDVMKVNTFDSLYAHRGEYVYFRTDHHWTALGAYYAYCEFAKSADKTPASLTDFEEKQFDGFYGAFYNDTKKNAALAKNPDTVYAYAPKGNVKLTFIDQKGNELKWSVITDVTDWTATSKYSTFIGGDNPYTHIVNEDITDGSSCVVIKESFGNAFVPFLTSNYSEIHVIDYRYWKGSVAEFVTENGVDDVIFINNISATRNNSLVDKLSKTV